jgi:hypothetical protein
MNKMDKMDKNFDEIKLCKCEPKPKNKLYFCSNHLFLGMLISFILGILIGILIGILANLFICLKTF